MTRNDPYASVRRYRRANCPVPTKIGHRDLFEAAMEALDASLRDGIKVTVYICPGCGYYHLTRNLWSGRMLIQQIDSMKKAA